MTKKFNLRDFIDDIAEVSSSSSSPSDDEDYLIPSRSNDDDNEEENSNNNTTDIVTETSFDIDDDEHHHHIRRKHFIMQSIKDEEKEIKSILDRNFKRIKSIDSYSDQHRSIPKKKTDVSLCLPIISIDHSKKFHLGFKRKQSPGNPTPKSKLSDSNTESLLLPNIKHNDTINSLKYSHEKKMKKILIENSLEFDQAFKERIREDDAILQNVIKKKLTFNKNNNSKNISLFQNKLTLNKAASFLYSMKDNQSNTEGHNNKQKTLYHSKP